MSLHDYDMDDAEVEKGKSITDFDCPGCNANNPADPPLADGGEVMCHYCGSEFKVLMGEGRVRFKEV